MTGQPFDREQLLQLSKEQLVEIILQLETRLARLEVQLGDDSTTSSKPPSTDLLRKSEMAKPKAEDDTPKRKPGGQPGHKGSTRKGFGTPDRYEILRPERCGVCGHAQLETLKVSERQVACLALQPIEVVSFSRHTCYCPHCQTTTVAPWPERLCGEQDIDIGLQSVLGWLGTYGQLSYEKQAEFVEQLCGWRPSVGTLATVNDRLAKAVAPAVQTAWQYLRVQPVVYVDETPWPVMGTKEWLWQFGTEQLSLFHAGDTRGRIELSSRLGLQFGGCLVSDDFSVYNGYAAAAQQKCLAHLRRHFKKIEKLSPAEPVGLAPAFIALIDEAFAQYATWQQSAQREVFNEWAAGFKLRVHTAIGMWLPKASYEAGKLLRSLRDKASQWWYFLYDPSVRPDNNLSERNLRLAVTRRKVSGGSRTMDRFAQTADLLSVVQTCRRQYRSAMEFFVKALQANSHATFKTPSLIPEPNT
jgi:transposase